MSLAVVQIPVLAIELIFVRGLAWEEKTCIGVGSGAGSCTSLGIDVTTGTSIGVGTDIGNYVGTRTRTTRTAIAVPGTQNAPRRNVRSTVNPPRCLSCKRRRGVLDRLTSLCSALAENGFSALLRRGSEPPFRNCSFSLSKTCNFDQKGQKH